MSHPSLRLGLTGLFASALFAQLPSPALIVLNKETSELAIVDPSTRQVTGRVPTGEGPHEVVVSGDGRMAFVSNYGGRSGGGKTISVIDLAAKKELRRVDLGVLARPHGIAYLDGKVYFTAEANKLIGRYDPANSQVDWLMGTGQSGTHMVLISPNGRQIVTANIASGTLTVLDRQANPANWDSTVIPVGKGPEGLDFSPDGQQVWAAHSQDGGVSVVDLASKKVLHTLSLGTKRSNRLKFTPDGKTVLVSDMGGGELVVLDAAARKEKKRLKVGTSPEGILITPDSKQAYVAVNGDNQIAVIDLNTLEVTHRLSPGNGPDGMAWSVSR